jgi:6-phosphofructokinase 1
MKQINRIGILTAGGDCPGLNAAIRGVGKAVLRRGIEAVGIRDGFLGLIENHTVALDQQSLAGILTVGGTVLGTSRVKPHRMEVKGRTRDLRDVVLANCKKNGLDAVVCIGG